MTPSPRLRAVRWAGAVLAVGVAASLVTVAVVALRRATARRGRSGRPLARPRRPPPERRPRWLAAGAGRVRWGGAAAAAASPAPAVGGAGGSVAATGRGGDRPAAEVVGDNASLLRLMADGAARTARGRRRDRAATLAGTSKAAELPLDFLAELHERFEAGVDEDADETTNQATSSVPHIGAARRNGDTRGRSDVDAGSRGALDLDKLDLDLNLADIDGGLPKLEPDAAGAGIGAPAPDAPDVRATDGAPAPPTDGAVRETWSPRHRGAIGRLAGRRSRPAGVAVAGVAVAVAVAVVVARAGEPATTTGGAVEGAAPPPAPEEVFAAAAARLRDAGSFSYTGAAHVTAASRIRPGLWVAPDVLTYGDVDLATGRVHDTAIAADGASETIVDGTTVWGRSAPTPIELQSVDYQIVTDVTNTDPATDPAQPGPMGAALVPVWLSFAAGAEDAGPDAEGRQTYRATVPAAVITPGEAGEPVIDAEVVLTLDAAGQPVQVQVTGLPDGASLTVVLDPARFGARVLIVPPGQPAT